MVIGADKINWVAFNNNPGYVGIHPSCQRLRETGNPRQLQHNLVSPSQRTHPQPRADVPLPKGRESRSVLMRSAPVPCTSSLGIFNLKEILEKTTEECELGLTSSALNNLAAGTFLSRTTLVPISPHPVTLELQRLSIGSILKMQSVNPIPHPST